MKIALYILFVSLLASCSQTSNKIKQEEIIELPKEIETEKFDYDKFLINKGSLGPIKIGMTISEAEKSLGNLTKVESEAFHFGFDGGGIAYLYYDNKDVVLGLIPQLNNDTIISIIAASNRLKTKNDISPISSIKELSVKYPKIELTQNLLNSWEEITDTSNNWTFVFMSDENNKIGEYKDLFLPATQMKNMDAKSDWITIK